MEDTKGSAHILSRTHLRRIRRSASSFFPHWNNIKLMSEKVKNEKKILYKYNSKTTEPQNQLV